MRNHVWRKSRILMGLLVFLHFALITFLVSSGEENEIVEQSSNQLSIAEIAVFAEEIKPAGPGEALPEGSLTVSIHWIDGDETAPEVVTAIIAGNGAPWKTELTREGNWEKTILLPDLIATPVYSLIGLQGYTVEAVEGGVRFHVPEQFAVTFAEGDDNIMEESLEEGEAGPGNLSVSVQMAAVRDGAMVPDGEAVYYGDTIRLTGVVENPDGVPCAVKWECNPGDEWRRIDGGWGAVYEFVLSEENLSWEYRAHVVPETTE